jgi:hypothetical protein
MNRLQIAMLLAVILSTSAAADMDFPQSPINLKEAEAQGLHRMSAAEIKPLFPGKMDIRQYNGELRTTVTNADGSLETRFVSSAQKMARGTWRIDEQNNLYCSAINWKKGLKDNCFAVFQAPDGIHYFSYDIKTGFAGGVWRRATNP